MFFNDSLTFVLVKFFVIWLIHHVFKAGTQVF
jgi:hypothetical protein